MKGGNDEKIKYLSKLCLHIDNTGKTKEELKELYNTLLKNIMIKSFPYENGNFIGYFDNLRNDIKGKLPESATTKEYEKKEWLTCSNVCYNITSKAILNEIKSTAYMLRVLSNSLISYNKCNQKLYFSYENTNENGEPGNLLTGNWEYDSKHFTITKIGKGDDTNSRLIMGLGPSASGKTYWARNVIELLNQNISDFPSTFFTIDGGDYRSLSYVYQIIIESAKNKGLGGIDNLVLPGSIIPTTKKNIFDSNIVKKDIIKYLNNSKTKNSKLYISLYVPETLGDCSSYIPTKLCKSKIEKYVNLTGDKEWVALMIYQHKSGDQCPYDLKYQCVGTNYSGKSRESEEGKKYSDAAYQHSMNEGRIGISKAPNMKFIIHNSGGKKYKNQLNKSIMMDMSVTTPFDNNNIQNIQDKYHCVYQKINNINQIK
jgi:hypothetical protein|tara:strand:+ start:757 stop:2040 length:1284 start_codon:yes stop_codon:yes gene_type:complete